MAPYNPYAPPQPGYGHMPMPMPMPYGGGMGIYPSGDALIVPKGAMLPQLCVKCARREGLMVRNESFSWAPPWLFVFFMFGAIGAIIGAVVYASTRKTGSLALPMCPACNTTWDKGRRNIILMAVGIPILTIALSIVAGAVDEDLIGFPILLGMLGWLIAPLVYHFAVHRKRSVWSKRVDDTSIHVVGFHPEAAHAACSSGGNPYGPPGPPMGGYGPPPQAAPPGYGGYGPPPQW